jgi:hypothetical protein
VSFNHNNLEAIVISYFAIYMSLSLAEIFSGKNHQYHPEIDLVATLPPQEGVFDIMLRAIPPASDRHEVVGTVGRVKMTTGEMQILQPSLPEDRLPVPGNIRPDAQDRLEDIRAWLGAAVQTIVAESGYQPFGDFFSAQE